MEINFWQHSNKKIRMRVTGLGDKSSISNSAVASMVLPPPPSLAPLRPISSEGISQSQPPLGSREGLAGVALTLNPSPTPPPSSNTSCAFSHGGSHCQSPSRMATLLPTGSVPGMEGNLCRMRHPARSSVRGASWCPATPVLRGSSTV